MSRSISIARKLSNRKSHLLLAAAASAGLCSSVLAADGSWTYNFSSNWSDASAWRGGTIASGVDAVANFNSINLPANLTVTLDTARTIGSMIFGDTDTVTSAAGWLLQGPGTLTLDVTAGSPLITVNALAAGSVVEISAPVAGNDGLTKNGAGVLVLSGANSYSGTTQIDAGTLRLVGAAARGNSNLISMSGGVLDLRADPDTNFVAALSLTGNATVNVDAVGGPSGPNNAHSLGAVTMGGTGNRTLTVASSNNNMGLSLGVISSTNNGNVTTTNNSTGGVLTIGGFNNATADAKTWTINGAGSVVINGNVTQTGGGLVSITVAGLQTATFNAVNNTGGALSITGGGTVLLGSGATLPGGALTVSNGLLDLSGAGAVNHSAAGINIGGGDLATISTGTGTLGLTGDVVRTAGGGSVATINGNLNLGASNRAFTINGNAGTTDLLVNAAVSGTGGLTKSGPGEMQLTAANSFSGGLTVNAGTLSGIAQASGTPFTASATTINGGALKLIGGGAAAGGSIGTLTFGNNAPAQLVVDGTAGNPTTLTIAAMGGRVGGTSNTLTLVPQSGSLGTNEIFAVTTAPTLTNGILPAHTALQASGTNTALDFVGYSGGNLTVAAYSGSTDINTAGANAVFNATGAQNVTSTATVYALRSDGQTISGGTLVIGNGAGQAGIILNNGAQITTSNLSFGNAEGIIWAGGTSAATISSGITLSGDLTTAGAQTLTLSGAINLNGATRTIRSTGTGPTVISGSISNGSLTKAGPGTLTISGANGGYSGTTTISNGTLAVATTGALGSGTVVNNAALSLEPGGDMTFANNVEGPGGLYHNGGSSTTLTGALTYTGPTVVNNGVLRINAANRLPTAGVLTVNGGAFDLNGFAQTVGTLTGTGGEVRAGVAGTTTLTVGAGSYAGVITNNGGVLALNKTGPGVLSLSGSNGHTGGTYINGGTIAISNAASTNTGSVVLNGGALAMGALTYAGAVAIGPSNIGTVAFTGPFNSGSFSGAATIAAGQTLVVDPGGVSFNNFQPTTASINAGAGTLKFAGSGGIRLGYGNNTTVSSPNLTVHLDGPVTVQPRGGTFTWNIGALIGTADSTLAGNQTGVGARTINYNIGSLNTSTTFAGAIVPGAGGSTLNLSKFGTGTLTLSGVSTYNGNTNVNAGVLELASGGALNGSSTLTIANGATFLMSGTGTLAQGTTGMVINTGASSLATGVMNVSGVTGGFSTPTRVTLSGNGTISGAVTHNAGTINPGGLTNAGTLHFTDLSLTGGVTQVNLDAPSVGVLGGGTNDLVAVANNLNISGTPTLRLAFNGIPAVGDIYPIFQFGTTSGSLAGANIIAGVQGSFSLLQGGVGSASIANAIYVKVDNLNATVTPLFWTGNENANWDVASSTNWRLADNSPKIYFQNDAVTFDDTTGVNTVNVTTQVQPNSMTIAGGAAYTFNGTGTIAGATSIVKNGGATLTINTQNTYTGGTVFNEGTIITGNFAALGTGSVIMGNNTALVINQTAPQNEINVAAGRTALIQGGSGGGQTGIGPVTGAGTLNLDSTTGVFDLRGNMSGFTGTLNFGGAGGYRLNVGVATIDFGTATLNLNDRGVSVRNATTTGVNIGYVVGQAASVLAGAGGSGATQGVTYSIGSSNIDNIFDGVIQDGGGSASIIGVTSLAKVGTATLELTNTSTYTGTTSVNAGVLKLSGGGALSGTSAINVAGSATLLVQNGGALGGTTQINLADQGTLDLTAVAPFNTPSGVTFAGTGGTVRGSVNHGAGRINPGGPLAIGTVNFANDLSLQSGGTSSFDLGSGTTLGGGVNDLVNVVGNLDLTGGNIAVAFTGPATAGSVYTLMTYGTKSGSISNMTLVNNSRGTATLSESTAGQINLIMLTSSVSANLKWTSTSDSNWNIGTTQNWLNTGNASPDVFFNGDSVLFNDDTAGVQTTVNLASNVAPASVTVNSTTNSYTINGPGAITGATSVAKNGGSNLTMAAANTYTGGTTVSAGTLTLANASGAGTGSIMLTGTGAVAINADVTPGNELNVTGNNVLGVPAAIQSYGGALSGNGTLTIVKTGTDLFTLTNAMDTFSGTFAVDAASTGGAIRFNNGGTNVNSGSALATFDLGNGTIILQNRNAGTINLGALKGGVNTRLTGQQSGTGNVVYSIGANGVSTTFAGVINDNSTTATTGIAKVGTGTLTLTGANTYTGTTTVNGGKLVLVGTAKSPVLTGNGADILSGRLILDYADDATVPAQVLAALDAGYDQSPKFSSGKLRTSNAADPNKGLGWLNVPASTQVTVAYTYLGDTNLDGQVDITDLGNLATAWQTAGVWAAGDSDYSGFIDITDLGALATNWQAGVGNPLAPSFGEALAAVGLGGAAVPEPASLGLVGLGLMGLISRRRRRA